ncbi:unnamed protein product [Camellia sinensis]
MFKSFWKKEDMMLKKFKKVEDNVMDVIKSYDFHAKRFKLGGKTCDIRDSDRRFRNMSRIFVKSLREALGDALEGMTVDVENIARIMCLFVVATLLLPTIGLTVRWDFVALVEDLEMMNSYAWSTAVASTLTTSIQFSLGSPENVTGCVLHLLVNHDELKPISREEMKLIRNDEEEDALDIEENLETKEDEDHVAEALGDDQPLKDFIDLGKLEQVQKENKRLKSENMALDTKQAIEVISNEVICVDNLPLSKPKPVERILFLDKVAICKLLDENDKCLLSKIYNLKTTKSLTALLVQIVNPSLELEIPKQLFDPNVFNAWMVLFLNILERPVPVEGQPADPELRKSWGWCKVKKWTVHILNRLYTRFGDLKLQNPENRTFAQMFQKNYAGKILEYHLNLLNVIRVGGYLPDRVTNFILQYLSNRFFSGRV